MSFVGTTLYQYFWDVRMDWGLGNCGSKNTFLRDKLIYKSKILYFLAIIIDLVLRFFWTLSLLPEKGIGPFPVHIQVCIPFLTPLTEATTNAILLQLYLDPVFASAEVFRRSMWSYLRVEYEHTVRYDVSFHAPYLTTRTPLILHFFYNRMRIRTKSSLPRLVAMMVVFLVGRANFLMARR